jgi:D-alanyl-D-alanine dipeptidase
MYIADPKLSPPHASGGTFDLTIVNRKDEELDMGTKLNSVNSKSNTFNEKISKKQMANRLILFSTLEKVGFVNIPSEWWHYSYGDQYWAIYYKKAHAIYGKVDLKNA